MRAEVGYDAALDTFVIQVAFHDNWVVKNAPDRTWDRKIKRWRLPRTNLTIRYLKENFQEQHFTNKALGVMDEIRPPSRTPFPLGYEHTTPPLSHQLEALDRAWGMKNFALFHEMGLGKTFTAITLACARYMHAEIEALLVICPTPIKAVWPAELSKHKPEVMNEPDTHVLMAGAKGFDKFLNSESIGMKVLVAGIEGLSQGNSYKHILRFVQRYNCMCVVDESTRIKNHKATRTDRVIDIGSNCEYRLILNGTPITQGMQDLYSQFAFLDWKIIGSKTYFGFRGRYCVMGGFESRNIVGYRNVTELMAAVEPYAHTVRKNDVLDLPAKTYTERVIPPSREQRQATVDLKTLLRTEQGDDELSVRTVLERMTRYQQIAGGLFPYKDEEGEFQVKFLDGENPKITAMLEELQDIPLDRKVIIWARFRPEIQLICVHLAQTYGAHSYREFHGGIDEEDRKRATEDFMHNETVRFMVSNQQTGGMGQTWTAANYVIYYSNTFSYMDRVQSEDRCHGRLSKLDNKVTYIDLRVQLPIDMLVKKALAYKTSMADYVTANLSGNQWDEHGEFL